jgi:hypothetical protein
VARCIVGVGFSHRAGLRLEPLVAQGRMESLPVQRTTGVPYCALCGV